MNLTSTLAVILSVKMHLLQTSTNEGELLRQFPMTPRHLVTFVVGFLKSFLVTKWYGGTAFAITVGVIVACIRRGRSLLPPVLLIAYILLYAFHIRSYYEMKSGLIEPLAAIRFSMNFMALWAIAAGLGIGSIVTYLGRNPAWKRHQQLSVWFVGTGTAVTLAVAFVATVRLRDYEVEDEAISRLTPAMSATYLASRVGGNSNFVVTMEPLVIQMYADPATRIVDLESVKPVSLQALRSGNDHSHLIFLMESDDLSDDDLSRYRDQVRYLLSLRSSILQSSDRFQILKVESSDSH
jgi:hypothetical protein